MFCVCGYTLDVVWVVCMCCSRILYTVIFIQPSWQLCTGDAAPRVVNMHGVRVVYMYEEGVFGVIELNGFFFNPHAPSNHTPTLSLLLTLGPTSL